MKGLSESWKKGHARQPPDGARAPEGGAARGRHPGMVKCRHPAQRVDRQ